MYSFSQYLLDVCYVSGTFLGLGLPWWLGGKKKKKNHLPMQKTQVQSLSWEDPLEEGMATHSRILAWRIPWTEKTGKLQPTGSQRVGYN